MCIDIIKESTVSAYCLLFESVARFAVDLLYSFFPQCQSTFKRRQKKKSSVRISHHDLTSVFDYLSRLVQSGACCVELSNDVECHRSDMSIENGDIVSDPFGTCANPRRGSEVEIRAGKVVGVSLILANPNDTIWWVNVTVLFAGDVLKAHIVIVKSKREATETASLYEVGVIKWFNVANNACDPNSGQGHPFLLVIFVLPVLFALWSLYRQMRECKSEDVSCREISKRCDLSSLIHVWILLFLLPLWLIYVFSPSCEKQMCSRQGTYPLPMMNGEELSRDCPSRDQDSEGGCFVVWKLQDGPSQIDLVSLNGTCRQAVDKSQQTSQTSQDTVRNRTSVVLVNPSDKSTCDEIPEKNISWRRSWLMFGIAVSGWILLFLFLMACRERLVQVDQDLQNWQDRWCPCTGAGTAGTGTGTGYIPIDPNQRRRANEAENESTHARLIEARLAEPAEDSALMAMESVLSEVELEELHKD